MKKIAVLGAEGSFSSVAAKKYIEKRADEKYRVIFYKSFNQVAEAVGKECDLAVIPIENSLDGYIHIVLDILIKMNFKICSEIMVPVEYLFVGNGEKIEDIKKVYVQFKAQEQCIKFFEKTDIKIFTTESHTESFEMVNYGIDGEGAVIPKYLFEGSSNFKLKIDDVITGEKNEIRFIVVANKCEKKAKKENSYKSSIIVEDAEEREAAMSEIINEFSEKNIKLISIISRPTKMKHGKYHFFVDIAGDCTNNHKIAEVIENIGKLYEVKQLGSYDIIR